MFLNENRGYTTVWFTCWFHMISSRAHLHTPRISFGYSHCLHDRGHPSWENGIYVFISVLLYDRYIIRRVHVCINLILFTGQTTKDFKSHFPRSFTPCPKKKKKKMCLLLEFSSFQSTQYSFT